MKTAAICATKNEADIIEAFVRLNAPVCDCFLFADDSTDNTRAILDRLAGEGYEIHHLPKVVREGEHNQPHTAQRHLAYVVDEFAPDWIFFLDADEIVVADDRARVEAEIRSLTPDAFLVAPWRTYVPRSLDYFSARSPLSECFVPRVEVGPVYCKASIPGRRAKRITTTAGNHSATALTGEPLIEVRATSYALAHFPVRSSEQIVVKNLIATHNLEARPHAGRGEGSHVRPVLETIRSRGYRLTLDDLVSLANGYAVEDPRLISGQAGATVEPDGRFTCDWKYRELATIDIVARLDVELERYAAALRAAREELLGAPWSSVRLRLHPPPRSA